MKLGVGKSLFEQEEKGKILGLGFLLRQRTENFLTDRSERSVKFLQPRRGRGAARCRPLCVATKSVILGRVGDYPWCGEKQRKNRPKFRSQK